MNIHYIGVSFVNVARNSFSGFISFCNVILLAKFVNGRSRKVNNGGECYVLANGPSLLNALLNYGAEIKKLPIITMNFYTNTQFFFEIQPAKHILLDPFFFKTDYLENVEEYKTFINVVNKINWDLTLILPIQHQCKNLTNRIHNEHISFEYYNAIRCLGPDWLQNLMYKYGMGIPSTRNVLIPSIMYMLNSGYSTINVLGTDFSWIRNIEVDPKTNRMYMDDKHFYSEHDIIYMEKGLYKARLIEQLDSINGLEQLEKYSKYCGSKIVNRTAGSFIDCFESHPLL